MAIVSKYYLRDGEASGGGDGRHRDAPVDELSARPGGSKAAEGATWEAAGTGTRGSGCAPSGRASPLSPLVG